MSDLSDRIASLPLEKRRALEALLERAGPAPAKATIPRHDPATPIPLSFAQQRLWFLDQLAGAQSQSLYTVAATWQLTGPLDHGALAQALDAIVERHSVLRTSFPLLDGQPIQVIRPSLSLDLTPLDLRALAEDARAAAAHRYISETIQGAFDLARGPLFRAALLRLADDEHWLAVSMHHTVSDGWSVGIFTNELAALYTAYATGGPPSLPALAIQYADFAAWQRSWLEGAGADRPSPLQTQLAYWRRALANLPVLSLPTDRPRPAIQTFQGTTYTFAVPAALTHALKALSQREGATLFMTLLAAFDLLLSRYSGQEDLSVGTPFAGRTRVETEALIGLFVNTLVLRADLSGNPRFIELLQRVRAVCMGAYANLDLPFEKLVEAIQPQRDLSYNPLFQVLFGLHNTPRPTVTLPGLVLDRLGDKISVARFDLSLDIREIPGGLLCGLEYNTGIFEAATITRLSAHFQTLLAGIVAGPERRCADLPLLTPAEQRQLLVDWNDTAAGVRGQGSGVGSFTADASCLHELFEAQAAQTPDAIALMFEGSGVRGQGSGVETARRAVCTPEQLTYAELSRRANQLAQHLRARGVGPDVLVGVCIERSLELMIALLGVLKAGGAYVPLDPQYPPDRLAFMIKDSRVEVLITQQSIYDLPLTIDDLGESDRPIANRKSKIVNVDNLAYVIYTSGSTGRPKGVAIQHRSVSNLLAVTRPLFAFGADDVWTVVHSYAFDFSVWEIWGCLGHGGRLVIVPLEVTRSPATFYELLGQQRVTILNQTPSAIRPLIAVRAAATDGPQPTLRVLMCGGEAFPRELAAPLLEWGLPLWNFYGPTESTVWAAISPLDDSTHNDAIPIGPPLANVQLYILDAQLQFVPIGVPGELYIGGAQLARGYFNRPELTAEKFIPNPFAGGDKQTSRQADKQTPQSAICNLQSAIGTRLYKTGDLVRRLPSGAIEFLGRIDQQIKLRGFRIELAEIEVVLRQHPAVREAVVVAREDTPGDKRLIAYVVQGSGVKGQGSDSEDKETRRQGDKEDSDLLVSLSPGLIPQASSLSSELRAHLGQTLPNYMVPSAFVLLDALPLSSNGKVDRRALPPPDGTRPDLAAAYLPPRTALERTIAAIWQELLHIERVGVNDTFFDLGGHSLLMVQVQSKLREALQRDISLLDMFRHPTVGRLAAYFSQEPADQPALLQSQARTTARHESRDRQQQTLQSRRQARRAAARAKGDSDD